MSQLALDRITAPQSRFVGGRTECAAEAMRYHLVQPPHPLNCPVEGHVGDTSLTGLFIWQQQLCGPTELPELAQQLQRLGGERDQVIPAHLHPLCRDQPLSPLQIKVSPARLEELLAATNKEYQQFKPEPGQASSLSTIIVQRSQEGTERLQP